MCSCSITIYTGSVARPPRDMTRRSTHEPSTSPSTPSGLASPRLDQVRYRFVTIRCLDEITFSNVPYSQDIVERSTKNGLLIPVLLVIQEIHALSPQEVSSWPGKRGRSAGARGRLNVGDGAALWHRPTCRGQDIMTDLILAPRQRSTCWSALVSQESGAHTGNGVVLLQTPAAAKTADDGVKLSAEASRVVTGIRSASRSHGVRVRGGRHAPSPTAPMAYERHLRVTTSGHRP
jgi:hypothetical protein